MTRQQDEYSGGASGLLASVEVEDDPLAKLIAKEEFERAHCMTLELPIEQAEVVGLQYLRNRNLAAISVSTERPLGTVKSQLSRALSRLRSRSDDAA